MCVLLGLCLYFPLTSLLPVFQTSRRETMGNRAQTTLAVGNGHHAKGMVRTKKNVGKIKCFFGLRETCAEPEKNNTKDTTNNHENIDNDIDNDNKKATTK